MKPITITLTTTIDEEIDQAIYGDFYAFSRFDPVHPGEVHPWVQMKQGGEWIPVQDWKGSRYMCTAATLRRLARHFIEVGKHMAGQVDAAKVKEQIEEISHACLDPHTDYMADRLLKYIAVLQDFQERKKESGK